jgi:Ala-tRNA(Pro) deacylase
MELHEAEGNLSARLVDGSAPATTQELLERLAALGIAQRTVSHPPLYTVAESKELRGQLSGLHIKNLFLRNKKGVMWLVTCLEDRAVDLKWLGEVLGAGRFSFGSAERLMANLGVSPGAVTPFGVINDKGGAVAMVLDSALVGPELVNAHPLVNDRTTAVSGDDLVRFLQAADHPPRLLVFP